MFEMSPRDKWELELMLLDESIRHCINTGIKWSFPMGTKDRASFEEGMMTIDEVKELYVLICQREVLLKDVSLAVADYYRIKLDDVENQLKDKGVIL